MAVSDVKSLALLEDGGDVPIVAVRHVMTPA